MATIDYSGSAAKYKYNVLGATDSLLKAVGKFATSDSAFSTFKRKRIEEQKTIAAAGDYPTVKSTAVELKFLQDSLKMVKTAYRADNSTSGIDAAVQKITKEVAQLANNYSMIDMASSTGADDEKFTDQMNALLNDLEKLVKKQNIALRGQGKFYNSTINSSEKYIAQARKVLDDIAYTREDYDNFQAIKKAKEAAAAAAANNGASGGTTSTPVNIVV